MDEIKTKHANPLLAFLAAALLILGGLLTVQTVNNQARDDTAANRACAPVCIQRLGGACVKWGYWYQNTPYPCVPY